MELIDKDALVAEIKKRIADNKKEIERAFHKNLEEYFEGYEDALALLKQQYLDTLEVKEIDLEKEFYDFLDTLIGKDNGHLSEDELFSIAEYFFELGLKAKGAEGICKESETNCPNFDEAQGTPITK